jgi:hypothetical protein
VFFLASPNFYFVSILPSSPSFRRSILHRLILYILYSCKMSLLLLSLPFRRTHTFIVCIFSSFPSFHCLHLFIVSSFHCLHPFIILNPIIVSIRSSLRPYSLHQSFKTAFTVPILSLSPSFCRLSLCPHLYYETLKCKTCNAL